jgi:ankyrin repeat protein
VADNQLDAWDDLGYTPLLYAVVAGDVERVRELLAKGADPNRASRDYNETPLWHAEDNFGLMEIAALLRQYGATAK